MEPEKAQLAKSNILLRDQSKVWEKIAKRKTISWWIFTSFFSILVGYIYSLLPLLLIAIINSIIIGALLVYALDSRMDRRGSIGGMHSPYIIAFGIVVLLWCGGLFSSVYHLNKSVLYLMIILAFMVGFACIYIGFKRGPVHGWE